MDRYRRESQNDSYIREPIVDCIFYPATEYELKNSIGSYIQQSPVISDGVQAILTPHAGYDFAGKLLAGAYKSAAARTIDTVIIIGPVHRDPEEAVYFPVSTSFRTPMGLIPTNEAAIEAILYEDDRFIKNEIPHLEEHCIEVQLPYIQYLFPEADIVPILMGNVSKNLSESLGSALDTTFGKNLHSTLLVATSNLTAYLEFNEATKQADQTLEMIENGDWDSLFSAYNKRKISCCGCGCLYSIIAMKSIVNAPDLLLRGDSCQTNGDTVNTVQYAALAIK
jgi:MEMO1 family protein